MQNDIRYSIIIPHKDSTELLRRCLHSIPERGDIEVIVVDDNSQLDAEAEATFPGKERNNVTCIFNKETGRWAGGARNIGLEKAHGEWLIFADADDYFEPGAFDVFDKHASDSADIVFFNVCSRFSDTGEPSNRDAHLRPLLEGYRQGDIKSEYLLRLNFHEPWAKMIRHQIVRKKNLVFDEIRWANDEIFTTKLGCYAKEIAVDLSIVYCITVAQGSLVHQRSLESRRCRYEVMLRANKILREEGLGQYQHSLMYSLRRVVKYGPKALRDFIQLGRQYDANFLIGWDQWLKNAWQSILHDEDRDKKKYIVKQ